MSCIFCLNSYPPPTQAVQRHRVQHEWFERLAAASTGATPPCMSDAEDWESTRCVNIVMHTLYVRYIVFTGIYRICCMYVCLCDAEDWESTRCVKYEVMYTCTPVIVLFCVDICLSKPHMGCTDCGCVCLCAHGGLAPMHAHTLTLTRMVHSIVHAAHGRLKSLTF